MNEPSDSDGILVSEPYDWASTDPSTAVVETVSRALDRDATEIPQLYESIDTDGLDTLLQSGNGETSIDFSYADRLVTVHASGTVVVQRNGDI